MPRARHQPIRQNYNRRLYALIGVRYTLDDFNDDLTQHCPTVERNSLSPNFGWEILPGMTERCNKCQALRFKCESTLICCDDGKALLEPLPPMPDPMFQLWQTNPHFRNNIRSYNQVLSFCSLGTHIDHTVANERAEKKYSSIIITTQ